jgi:L,D-peptidoglycan transpeptidase YkuD (ErfK/YbiS/YcfS/YnhG family)
VVGLADGWDADTAQLQRYERAGAGWRRVGEPVPAVLGGAGLAWGRGLHGAQDGRQKAEGDDRSPAGAFRLVRAYGYAAEPVGGAALPYQALDANWHCVDDPESEVYNHVVDARAASHDWTSAEDMTGYGELYRWVIEVEHNGDAVPGAGSCIFLHVWSGADSTTLGCTAMPRESLEGLLAWLRPGAVYVLLPRAEYDARAAAWGLP